MNPSGVNMVFIYFASRGKISHSEFPTAAHYPRILFKMGPAFLSHEWYFGVQWQLRKRAWEPSDVIGRLLSKTKRSQHALCKRDEIVEARSYVYSRETKMAVSCDEALLHDNIRPDKGHLAPERQSQLIITCRSIISQRIIMSLQW